ncbi:hypothetical protein ACN9MZ_20480 [Pseudoduganella sp. S-14]
MFPHEVQQMLLDRDRAKAGRAMSAIMTMKKIELAALRKACQG